MVVLITVAGVVVVVVAGTLAVVAGVIPTGLGEIVEACTNAASVFVVVLVEAPSTGVCKSAMEFGELDVGVAVCPNDTVEAAKRAMIPQANE